MAELTPAQQRILEQAKQRQQGGVQQTTPLSSQQQAILSKYVPQQQEQRSPIDRALLSVPGMRPALEFGNAAARAVTDTADFFTTEPINTVMGLAGSQRRVPSITGSLESMGALAPSGSYMQPGVNRDIATAAGAAIPMAIGFQGAVKEGLRRVPQAIGELKSPARRVTETLASPTAGQEAAAATGAVVLGELGEETGIPGAGLVGALIGGAGAMPLVSGADRIFSNNKDLAVTAQNLTRINADLAGEILARSLRSSGMSVSEAMEQYRRLGPNAMPADITDSFRETMRAAMNIDEGIAGEARRAVTSRQMGAGSRISSSLDLIDADNLDDYLSRIDAVMKPEISRLYAEAGANPVAISGRLRNIMQGDNSLGRARQQAESRLADRRAAGDQITHFDVIDETKRVLDDQIGSALRDGRKNEVRNLTRLKNLMMNEADQNIPGYAQARATYAGRAALEDAANIGREFFQTNARELYDITSTMTAAEKTAYTLAAKDSILDRINNTGMTRDQVSALFGRNGDAMKLRTLFDSPRAFETFKNALSRETEYAITRRAVIGQSTTAAQLQRLQQTLNPPGGFKKVIGQAASVLAGGPAGISREAADIADQMRSTKGSEQYINGLIRAGDILLTAGMEPSRVEALLRRGSVDVLEAELRRIAEPSYARRAAGLTGAVSAQLTEDDQ
jgi:hypothetical protein